MLRGREHKEKGDWEKHRLLFLVRWTWRRWRCLVVPLGRVSDCGTGGQWRPNHSSQKPWIQETLAILFLCSAQTKCFGTCDEVWSLLVGSSGGRNLRQLITVHLQSVGRIAKGLGSVQSEAFVQSRTLGHRTLLCSDKVSCPVWINLNQIISPSHALRFDS